MGELSPGAAVAIGVLVGLISTTVQSIGLTLQRKSHLLEDEKEDEYARRPPYRRRRWQVGMSMFLFANIVGSTVQITTLPLPVLSTLQASGLVFNTICATLILHEPFTRYSVVGTILVASGAVLIGIFGAMTEPSHNLQQLLELLGRGNFLIWLFGTFFFAAGFAVAAWFCHHIWSRGHSRIRLIQGMMYGAVSGILSAHLLLVAKSAVELLVRTIVDQHNQFNRWQSWLILLALLALALSQLYFLHSGLKLCSTSVLYPFVFCVYNIIAILDGLIYFQQTSRLAPLHAGLIALGTVVLLVGVVALSWRLEESNGYTAVVTTEGGQTRRVRSMSRIATPTLPQTVLAPGMGIVEGIPTSTESENEDSSDETAFHHPTMDEESSLHHRPKRKSRANEQTPLLSSKNSPNISQTSLRSPVDRQQSNDNHGLRISKRRKTVAVPSATAELWDELVENDIYRRRSMDFGNGRSAPRRLNLQAGLGDRSPVSVRFQDRPISSSSGKAGASSNRQVIGHDQSASISSSGLLPAPSKWQLWNLSLPNISKRSKPIEIDPSDEASSEGSFSASHVRRNSDSITTERLVQHDRPAEWLKLRWWKKRLRGNSTESGQVE